MKIIHAKQDTFEKQYSGIGLGSFDGIHLGHMELIKTLIEESKIVGLQSLLYTFEKNPHNILRKSIVKPVITTNAKKIEILQETGLDVLYFEDFTEEYSKMAPQKFVEEILVENLGAKLVVIGFDYRFGHKGQGDADLMIQLGEKFGFKVIVLSPIQLGDVIVGSSDIRKILFEGDVKKAALLLGRHFSITGQVNKGKQIGRTLGFPTANIHPEDDWILPLEGVYITKTKIAGQWKNSVTHIGKNPTIYELEKSIIETFILNFDEDIYGQTIEIEFLDRIREEIRFNSLEELKNKMQQDIDTARQYFVL